MSGAGNTSVRITRVFWRAPAGTSRPVDAARGLDICGIVGGIIGMGIRSRQICTTAYAAVDIGHVGADRPRLPQGVNVDQRIVAAAPDVARPVEQARNQRRRGAGAADDAPSTPFRLGVVDPNSGVRVGNRGDVRNAAHVADDR